MGGSAMNVMPTGLIETEGSVDGQANFGRVVVLLAIVLPPADRT
jgi:hypothetical protein